MIKKVLLPMAIIACVPAMSAAEPVIGNQLFVGAQYLSVDDLDTDSSWGLTGGAHYFLSDMIYVQGNVSHQRLSVEETFMGSTEKLSVSTTAAGIGPGIELSISEFVGLYAEGTFGLANISFKYSEPGFSVSDSESGSFIGLSGGARFKSNDFVGTIHVGTSKIDVSGFDSDWEMAFGVGAGYYFTPNTAVGFTASFSEDTNAFGVQLSYAY